MGEATGINLVTEAVVDAALQIHRDLGPGLLESIYEIVLAAELERRGHRVERQSSIEIRYRGMVLPNAFRIDLLIDDAVLVEIKSVERLSPAHAKQTLSYLRLMDLRIRLLINFGEALLKSGIRRIANDYRPDQPLSASAPLRES
jgi:GxxExxY protein